MNKIRFIIFIYLFIQLMSCEKNFNDNDSDPIDNDTIFVNDTVIIVDTALVEFLDGWEVTKINCDFDFISKDIFFVNPEIGFLVGYYGEIYKTINSGITWQKLESGTQKKLFSVFFLDQINGFISGGAADSPPDEEKGSILLRTNNGGETWSKIHFESFVNIINLYFFNELEGLALIFTQDVPNSRDYYIAKTNDGGNNWEFLDLDIGIIYNFFCVNDIVYVLGRTQNIFKSKDFGNTWETINTPVPINESIRNYYFINENVGIIESYDFYKTEDGGLTWVKVQFPITTFEYAFHFYNEKEGFSTELIYEYNDSIEDEEFKGYRSYQTYDGGETWYKSKLDDSNVFYHPFFPQRDIGFSYFGPEFYIIRRK